MRLAHRRKCHCASAAGGRGGGGCCLRPFGCISATAQYPLEAELTFSPRHHGDSASQAEGSGVHRSCHESPQPPMTLSAASNRGQPGDTTQTPGATRTEEIIYHLPLPGCKRRGPRKCQVSHGSGNTLPKYYSAPGIYCPSRQPPVPALGQRHALWEEAPAIPTIPSRPLL